MTNTRKLTLASLIGAIHVVVLIMANFFPGVELFLIIFIPTLTTLYSIYTKFKDLFIYFLSIIILCALFNPITTILYIVPAVLTGILYGLLVRLRLSSFSLLYLLTGLEMILFLFTNQIIIFLYKVDIIDTLKILSRLPDFEFFLPSIIFIVGFSQALISHLITKEEIKKLGFNVVNKMPELGYFLITVLLIILILPINTYSGSISFTILVITFFLIIPVITLVYINSKYWGIIVTIQLFAFLAVIPLFNILPLNLTLFPFLLVALIPFLVAIYEKFIEFVKK